MLVDGRNAERSSADPMRASLWGTMNRLLFAFGEESGEKRILKTCPTTWSSSLGS
jgi:hypothetical protein